MLLYLKLFRKNPQRFSENSVKIKSILCTQKHNIFSNRNAQFAKHLAIVPKLKNRPLDNTTN